MLELRTIARRAPSLALVATLLVSAFGATVPARAADPATDQPPVVRIQVVVKEIYIWDERELWGDGDFELRGLSQLLRGAAGVPVSANTLDIYVKRFSAGDV